jgi:hypothetical protein
MDGEVVARLTDLGIEIPAAVAPLPLPPLPAFIPAQKHCLIWRVSRSPP